MFGHDWQRGNIIRMGTIWTSTTFVWKCRRCKALVQASDSAGLPGHEPSLNGRHLTCDEVILSSVHDS